MLSTLFSIPDASSQITQTSWYSAGLFTEFLPVVYLVVGVLVGVLAIKYITQVLKGGMKRLLGSRRRR